MILETSALGFPRIGRHRELKALLERHWKGEASAQELQSGAGDLFLRHIDLQKKAGITHVPSGDASLYDHVLDLAQAFGAFPKEVAELGASTLDEYFLLARGKAPDGSTARPLEMTKWFDTNYHYLVPEIGRDTKLALRFNRHRHAYQKALAAGIRTRPVVLGPVSFLLLSKAADDDTRLLDRLPELLDAYVQLLDEVAQAGAEWVQLDEPCLCLNLKDEHQRAYQMAYGQLAQRVPRVNVLLTPYFGSIAPRLDWIAELPVKGLHLDLVRAPGDLDEALRRVPADRKIRLGVVDGRNVWRSDLGRILDWLEPVVADSPERFELSTSCSLLHCPVDLDSETDLDAEVKPWLAFSRQKLGELDVLRRALTQGREAAAEELSQNRFALLCRQTSRRVHVAQLRERVSRLDARDRSRAQPVAARARTQAERLKLPALPTTTIGSFPQTTEIRKKRASFRAGKLDAAEYRAFIEQSIAEAIRKQEELDLDVLVHGEPERNDMVEFFGEQLEGFAHTKAGWVQSYGSRCVKPPILFGDVQRKAPLTVHEASHAQSLTNRPVKGMLTGPVTILKWSFVRDDQPLCDTAQQIALSIRDEVQDLERAGIAVIQVDEPALREGLPLDEAEHAAYLRWSVDAFRLATAGAKPETQIHTHMCYSEFGEILDSIARLDADVISIESARSRMELLGDFAKADYPGAIGPGIYDIHSPRVPSCGHMIELLELALRVIPKEQLWVNPDCGLKTRSWEEVLPSLEAMVAAARAVRVRLEDDLEREAAR